jgi:transposase
MKRKGVTLALLWDEYRQVYPAGYSYSQFCEVYRKWRQKLPRVMRQKHKAGEKMFVDYAGHKMRVINPETGEIQEVEIFVATLGASSYTYAEAMASQTLPDWVGGHVRALTFFGGVPAIIVPDNLKAGVTKASYYEPELNPTYQAFAAHYQVAIVPTRVVKPQDKAKVETGVQVVERWVLAPLRDRKFFSLAELNAAMQPLLAALNAREMKHLGLARQTLFATLDQPALKPLPSTPYEYAFWKRARVHIDYHVAFEKHFYSVPHTLVGQEVDLRATEKVVEIFHKRTRVASHRRRTTQGHYSTLHLHMPPEHQFYASWSPARFQAWAAEHGPETEALVTRILQGRRHPQQAYRTCLGILGLAKKYPRARLEAACARANRAQLTTYKGVHNILKNNLDQRPLPAEELEQAMPTHPNIRGEDYYH